MNRRADGRIEKTITIDGKKKHFYGKTMAEVNKKITSYKEKEATGATYKEVAEEWWKNKKVAVNTEKGYKPALHRSIEWFGDKFIKDITPADINRAIQKFARTYADKTVRTQLGVINMIFAYGVAFGYCPTNTARDIQVPANLPKAKRTMPSSDDIKAIKDSEDDPIGLFAKIALYTGMRRGEILALHWEDVDIEHRRIAVTKSIEYVGSKPRVKKPKTEESLGYVPILDALLPHLSPRTGIIFSYNGDYWHNSYFDDRWREYKTKYNLHCTPHQLRHAYATMLYESGIEPAQAMVLLRHRQISTTIDVYTDIRKNYRDKLFKSVIGLDIK